MSKTTPPSLMLEQTQVPEGNSNREDRRKLSFGDWCENQSRVRDTAIELGLHTSLQNKLLIEGWLFS